jgi:predicted lipoprotein with Yx(FWY)xxD motif
MRRSRIVLASVVGTAGIAAVVASLAIAKSFTLNVAKNATVTNVRGVTTHPNIVVNGHGFAVYTLSGNDLKNCSTANLCLKFWPPVTVSSASKLSAAPGVKGKLGTTHHAGFLQVTLNGHLLYTFSADRHKANATGEGIANFGGVWHVVKAGGSKPTSHTTTTSNTSTTTTSTTTTTTSTYTYTY